jgi:hypothetical protein
MPSRTPLALDAATRLFPVDQGTLARCSTEGPGPTGRYAGEAVLWHFQEMTEEHARQIGSRGIGTYYGSEWMKGLQARKPKYAKKMLDKLRSMGVQSSNCVELMLLGIELYYEGLAELYGPQPGTLAPRAEENAACQPERLVEVGHQIVGRARDGRGLGRHAVDSARGSVAVDALQQADWKTVFFAKDATSEAKKTVKAGEGPQAGSPFVKGADSKTPINVRVKMDHYIVGFSHASDKQKREQANADFVKLQRVPFAVGFFEWGMHTFIFGYGDIMEVHWDKGPGSERLFEKSPFRTKALQWEHGVLAIPPESWPF